MNAVLHQLRKVVGDLRAWVIGVLLSAVAVAIHSWLAEQAVCMVHGSCAITGPRLTVLVLCVYLLVTAGIVLAVLLRRARARETKLQAQVAELTAPFEPIRVEDPLFHLYWLMKRPPREWGDFDAAYRVPPESLAKVIGGPFHAEGCDGRLGEDWSRPGKGQGVKAECSVCNAELLTTKDSDPLWVKLFDMRWDVLQELQRLNRAGNPLTSTVVLQKPGPGYWRVLSPPGWGLPARGPAR